MRLAAPIGLAALALAGPLVVWYLLRPRRPRAVVASTLLWGQQQRSASAATPWQRLRTDRTFWLVLAALAIGALALARPTTPTETSLADHTILVVDTSASMGALEDGRTRLELARQEAEDLLDGFGDGRRVSVIDAGQPARVVLARATEAPAALRALAGLSAGSGRAELSDAFVLAAALQQAGQASRTYLLTDGEVPAEHRAAAPDDLVVTAVGSDRPNLAVTRLEATGSGGDAEVFVQVRNFGLTPQAGRVEISAAGEPLVSRAVRVAARDAEDLLLPARVPSGESVLAASVEPVGDTYDALAADDRARTIVEDTGDRSVLVAGERNPFVEHALAAVGGVDVRTAETVPADLEGVDLLIVDGVAAPAEPRVPTLYLNPSRTPDGVSAGDPVETPTLTYVADHELLADVDLSELALASARPVESAALDRVAAGPDGTLLAAGRLSGQPVAHLAFDLRESNLPLQIAWPVLLGNALSWLTGQAAGEPLLVGDEARFDPPAGAEGVEVTAPSGERVTLDAARPRVRVDEPGVWQAAWVGPDEAVGDALPPRPLAVNVPTDESDLARPRPVPAERDGPPTGTGQEARAATEVVTGERVHGPGLLLGALGLLCLEWWLATRARARGAARARGGHRGWLRGRARRQPA